MDTYGRKNGELIGLAKCHGLGGNQVFAMSRNAQIMNDDNCMDVPGPNKPIKLVRCHSAGGNQAWSYDEETMQIKHKSSKKCLEKPDSKSDPTKPKLRICDSDKKTQKWRLVSNFKWQQKGHKAPSVESVDNLIENDNNEDKEM